VTATPKKPEPLPDIGKRLLELREAAGQNQEEFSARWKISARTYQSYERAESWPSGAFLRELAAAGINVNWLLTGVGEMRAEQPLRLHNASGKGLRAGALDLKGDFKPVSSSTDAELQRVQHETAALWRRLNRPGIMADIAGIDGELGHRLADMHAASVDRPNRSADSIAPLASLVVMLDEAYRAAELNISSADVARVAAEEYRAVVYEAAESVDDRMTVNRAVQVRHMRAAAWAKNIVLKNNPAGRIK
jgi:transcriptional regulator with XRE-family HTH domain